jgi:hypothetical protein
MTLAGGVPVVAGVPTLRIGGGGGKRATTRQWLTSGGWGDGRSPWGTVHSGGGFSREDRRWEAIPVVVRSDLGAVEGRGGGAELTVV